MLRLLLLVVAFVSLSALAMGPALALADSHTKEAELRVYNMV